MLTVCNLDSELVSCAPSGGCGFLLEVCHYFVALHHAGSLKSHVLNVPVIRVQCLSIHYVVDVTCPNQLMVVVLAYCEGNRFSQENDNVVSDATFVSPNRS